MDAQTQGSITILEIGGKRYVPLDTLPAVRWTPGAPPEDMRDGREIFIRVRDGRHRVVVWYSNAWLSDRGHMREADILAWADPQPPEGV